MTVDDSATGVKSARRVLEILEIIAQSSEPTSFLDLMNGLHYPKSSLHGLLSTMVDMRWLTLDSASRSYHIGVRPWEVGQSFQPSRDLVIRARHYLREVHSELGETVQLGILDVGSLDVVYLDKIEGIRALRLVSEVGARIPAYATAIGKCLLAARPDEELQHTFAGHKLERYTTNTVRDGDKLLKVLKTTRKRGYALDDGEYTSGVFCVAVPIRALDGTTIAAMSCSVPQSRIDLHELEPTFVFGVLKKQAEALSSTLGETFTKGLVPLVWR